MSDDRAEKLAAIAEEVRVCTACRLHQGTKNAVPGYGDVQAEILFIGEGPGFNEDQQGLPFVGKSGRYLDYLLDLIGMKREQVFITNVVKHRPPENRDPLADEILACKHYLDRQIDIINPMVIATLGRFSMERYFPGGKITKIHGEPKYDGSGDSLRAYYPMFHPAAALRTPPLRHDMEADMRRLSEVVAEVKRRRSGGGTLETPAEKPAPPEPPKTDDTKPPKQLTLF
jgi:uracil-DNA glycosylase